MRSRAVRSAPFVVHAAMASLTPSDDGKNEPPRICHVEEVSDCESRPRATPREEKGGYECEFVEPPPKQFQSDCSICLLVLREPHMVSCCGHSFCDTCIGRIQRDGKPCPLCNEPGFTTMANKGLKRALNEFQVRCPHRELGCEWVGELGKLDQHLNADPQPERQLEGCPFTSIKCIHCKDHMRRHVIASHQNECSKRPYTCEYCEEYESTFEDVANHWAECKCYLLPCPNNCSPSVSGIERQNLEHHVKKECPLTVVECDFHYAGCEVKLPRKDMAGHMKQESMAHISLLAVENQRLTKQLLERDEKMQQLMQQNTELSNRIDQQQKAYHELRLEFTLVKDTLQQAHREVTEKVTHTNELEQKANHELRKEVGQIKDALKRVQQDLTEKTTRTILPINIKMSQFKKRKYKNTTWYSPPFYTHMGGYKMCINVDANGYGEYEHTHVSMYTYLMRGEFDSHLSWPFHGNVTIQLLNQLEDRKHHTMTASYDDEGAGRVTNGERSDGAYLLHHILYSRLNFNQDKHCHYLKDNCLIFRVLSVEV